MGKTRMTTGGGIETPYVSRQMREPAKTMSGRTGKNEREARKRPKRSIFCGNVCYGIGPTWKYAKRYAVSATQKLGRKKSLSRYRKLLEALQVIDSRTHRKKWRMRAERPTAS